LDDFSSLTAVDDPYGTNAEILKVSITNQREVNEVFNNYEINCVIHLAAIKQVGGELPRESYRTVNFLGTKNLLSAMTKNEVRKFVFASTAAVYGGNCPATGFGELDLVSPISEYGKSKQLCEELIQSWCSLGNGSASIFRFFNVAGKSANGKMEMLALNLIPTIFRNYLAQVPVQIYGNDWETPDGSAIRDYIHVSDICNGLILGEKFIEKKPLSTCETFNLGTNRGYSVLEVLEEANKRLDPAVSGAAIDRRVGDAAISIANATKANQTLGFRAARDLQDIVDDYVSFLNNPLLTF
jgi:UDP-glucose 4-epimerase